MGTLTIRQFDADLKAKLRIRAARHGRSMEAEARDILRSALKSPVPEKGLGTWLHEQFMAAGFGDVEMELPKREPWTPSADLSE